MDLFILPHTTKVNRVIPKNAFENYTNSKQKKLFKEVIARITWTHKLSSATINLEAKDIKEIQLFKVDLKLKQDIQQVLDVIDKSIPYTIVFVIEHESMIYLSTSSKHPHPVNENKSVIDWTFKTDWFQPKDNKYSLQLKKSIDAVYYDFCIQLSDVSGTSQTTFQNLILFNKKADALKKEIAKLKSLVKGSQQFNNKVELNMELKKLLDELKALEL
jgi:hypothetical protein